MRSSRDRSMGSIEGQQQRAAVALVQGWAATYSTRQVALVLGVGHSTVARWMAGDALPLTRYAQDVLRHADLYAKRLRHNADQDARR